MIESDHSEGEAQDTMPPLEISSESMDGNKPREKRLREDTSEEESILAPLKKVKTADSEPSPTKEKDVTGEVNGTAENVKDNTVDLNINSVKDQDKGLLHKSLNETETKANVVSNESGNDEATSDGDDCTEEEDASAIDAKMEDASEEGIRGKLDEETNKEKKKSNARQKHGKSHVEDPEVVEGLELSVECASDKESSSSSDDEDVKQKKSMPKTIIVKAKPNDSELDISSSAAEKSDSQDASDVESMKTQVEKKGRPKGRASKKKKGSDSEEEKDKVLEDTQGAQTKGRRKKAATNKKPPKQSVVEKSSNVRRRKSSKTFSEEKDEEDENSNIAEEKKQVEKVSDAESEKSGSESENMSDDDSGVKNGKGRSSNVSDNKNIQVLKKYIRLAGIHVKSYNDLWADCKSNAAKVRCLKMLLEKNGVTGRPTIEKCKKAKQRNERLKDVAELNTSNIISKERVTRSQKNKDTTKELADSPETPAKRGRYKRVLSVVDSDSD